MTDDGKIREAQVNAHVKTYRPEDFADEFIALCKKYGHKDFDLTRSPCQISISIDGRDDYFMF